MIFNLLSFSSARFTRIFKLLTPMVLGVRMTSIFICLSILVILSSCQNRSVEFKTFNSKQWISESVTCTDYRNSVIKAMESEFELFLGMNETQLTAYLGKPEETLLYTRGQKFFNYYLLCDSSQQNNRILRIRFSALDQVNEVLVLD